MKVNFTLPVVLRTALARGLLKAFIFSLMLALLLPAITSGRVEVEKCKSVNGKYRPVNGKYRPVNGKYRPVNGKYRPVNGNNRPVNGKYRPVNGNNRPVNVPYSPKKAHQRRILYYSWSVYVNRFLYFDRIRLTKRSSRVFPKSYFHHPGHHEFALAVKRLTQGFISKFFLMTMAYPLRGPPPFV